MVVGDLNFDLLSPITKLLDKCLTKYDNYMVIGDVNYVLQGTITNTREKCLTNRNPWLPKMMSD